MMLSALQALIGGLRNTTSHAGGQQQSSPLPATLKHCCCYSLSSSYFFVVIMTKSAVISSHIARIRTGSQSRVVRYASLCSANTLPAPREFSRAHNILETWHHNTCAKYEDILLFFRFTDAFALRIQYKAVIWSCVYTEVYTHSVLLSVCVSLSCLRDLKTCSEGLSLLLLQNAFFFYLL